MIKPIFPSLFFYIFFSFKITGRENIPEIGGFILASNHVSYLDPVAVGIACRRKLNYMARHDLFKNPVFAWWLTNVGVFPVKRGTADISAMKEAIRRLKDGQGLVLFPEGSRSNDGLIGPAEPGAGFLAAKAGVPVIPVFIKGSERALPKGAKFLRPARIRAYIGRQIPIDAAASYEDIAERIMEGIRSLSVESSKK